jgi:E3 ubiquitin-protein ligase MYCBP2
VFGKLVCEGSNSNEGNNRQNEASASAAAAGVVAVPDSVEQQVDLKEHMVGILFSRSKLTHLQKQVSKLAASEYMAWGLFH